MEKINDLLNSQQTHSDSSEASPQSESMSEERRQKLSLIIQEARGAQSLAFLDEVELPLTVAAWARVLREVRTEDLEPAYEEAIRAWPRQRAFGAPDVYQAWRTMIDRRQYREMKLKLPGEVCAQCQGTGFEPVMDLDGKHQGVKPCTGGHR